MALSRLAALFAAEIRNHDWSDAPYRADRAGHRRDRDGRNSTARVLTSDETDMVRVNVTWVAAQVLVYEDPSLDIHEFAEACGVAPRFVRNTDGKPSRAMDYGVRWDQEPGGPRRYHRPGTYEPDPAPKSPEALWQALSAEEQTQVREARRSGLVSEMVWWKLVDAGGSGWRWDTEGNPPTFYMPRSFRDWLRKKFDRPAS